MSYRIKLLDEESGIEELFEGDDVNDVLQRASQRQFQYKTKKDHYLTASEVHKKLNDSKKYFANLSTSAAKERNEKRQNILTQFDKYRKDLWELLEKRDKVLFDEKEPDLEPLPLEPELLTARQSPQRSDGLYKVKKNAIDLFSNNSYDEKILTMNGLFLQHYEAWEKEARAIEKRNFELLELYNLSKKIVENKNIEKISGWNQRLETFQGKLMRELGDLNKLKTGYNSKEKEAIGVYNSELLRIKEEPVDFWDKEVYIFYNENNNILYVEYLLPNTSDVDSLKEIKYIQARDEFTELRMKKSEYEKYYSDVIYSVTIYTLYMIFINDECNCIEAVAFNGYVKAVDKATGGDIKPCIVSLFVKKEDIVSLNLKQVDARACFRKLKGVSSTELANQTPVPPIIKFDKNDKRFIESKEIFKNLDTEINIAAMDWEDFEHLVREIFEKEFSTNGGEVKVTQASRDGGVDAIAFDPDPIRGGKIVIQAKRYTNTVGVNAVRDLYGTVVNEGAIKGILVTTSDYGSDSYDFAKDKPITLLNGAHLLYLLEKHGHPAKIDLLDAKKLYSEK